MAKMSRGFLFFSPFHVASGGAWNGVESKKAAQQQLCVVVVRWFGGSKGLCAHPGMVQGLVDEAPMGGFGVICKVRRGRVSVDFRRSPLSREMLGLLAKGTKQIRRYNGGSSR